MNETIYIVGFEGYKSRSAAEAARDAEDADQIAGFFAEPPEPTTIEEARIVAEQPGKDKWGRVTYILDNGMIAIGLPDRPFESYAGALCAPETMYCGADYYVGPAQKQHELTSICEVV